MEWLGWFCTVLVLIGYVLNSKQMFYPALTVWIVGDIGWIVYDLYIDNMSHLALCVTIIAINIYGIINAYKKKYDGRNSLDT